MTEPMPPRYLDLLEKAVRESAAAHEADPDYADDNHYRITSGLLAIIDTERARAGVLTVERDGFAAAIECRPCRHRLEVARLRTEVEDALALGDGNYMTEVGMMMLREIAEMAPLPGRTGTEASP